jgi:hypothetical protein
MRKTGGVSKAVPRRKQRLEKTLGSVTVVHLKVIEEQWRHVTAIP